LFAQFFLDHLGDSFGITGIAAEKQTYTSHSVSLPVSGVDA
jgi:hypothetical protein